MPEKSPAASRGGSRSVSREGGTPSQYARAARRRAHTRPEGRRRQSSTPHAQVVCLRRRKEKFVARERSARYTVTIYHTTSQNAVCHNVNEYLLLGPPPSLLMFVVITPESTTPRPPTHRRCDNGVTPRCVHAPYVLLRRFVGYRNA